MVIVVAILVLNSHPPENRAQYLCIRFADIMTLIDGWQGREGRECRCRVRNTTGWHKIRLIRETAIGGGPGWKHVFGLWAETEMKMNSRDLFQWLGTAAFGQGNGGPSLLTWSLERAVHSHSHGWEVEGNILVQADIVPRKPTPP